MLRKNYLCRVITFVTRAAIGYVWIASGTTVAVAIIPSICQSAAAMVAETCIICAVLHGARFINGDTPVNRGVIRGYINCIPYGASVTVRLELQLSNLLVADKLEVEARKKVGFNIGGATSCTVAILLGQCIRDIIFDWACSIALPHLSVRAVIEHIHVEVATSEV